MALEDLSRSDFPVVWDSPEEAALPWSQQRLHYPRPVTPLTEDLRQLTQVAGMSRADAALDRPVVRRSSCFNGYIYNSAVPPAIPPEALATRRALADAKYVALAREPGRHWREHLPEVEALLDAMDAAAVERLAGADLLVELELTLVRCARLWEIHFLLVPSSMLAIDRFLRFHGEVFPGSSELDGTRLLQGVETKTVEAARELWKVAAIASDDERGQALAGYLQRYGRRCITMDPALPSLLEDPSTVRRELDEARAHPERDPAAKHRALIEERESATAAALESLSGYPRPLVDEFRDLLAAAREGTSVMETHNFYIDFGSAYRVRRVIRRIGAELAGAGAIHEPGDVFYLRLSEIRQALAGDPQPALGARARERAAEMRRFEALTPPETLGEPAAATGTDEITRATAKFMGSPPPVSEEPGTLRGHPGSRGRAQGPARVIHSVSESSRVQAGDVLVTEMTAAPWTPLFARIAALVTDAGGVLSHSAIVAREFGIPAVVGTGTATSLIRDGDLVEVDGDRGIVRILSAP